MRQEDLDMDPEVRGRSLKDDVVYDVKRAILRQSILCIIRIAGKVSLCAACLFLMWRGIRSFFPEPRPTPTVQAVPVQAAAASSAGAPLVLGLALVVLMLPIVTITFIRTMVSKRSNGVNAFTLGVYTAIDMILAYFMVGATFETTASVVLFVGAAIFSLVYNVAVMNYALRLEDEK